MIDVPERTGSYLIQPQSAVIDEGGEGLFIARPLIKAAANDDPDQYGLAGYLDQSGQWIIPPMYEMAGVFSEGIACVSLRSGLASACGFIDRNNKLLLPYRFYTMFWARFSDGLCPARESNDLFSLWGYIDKTGEWIIKPQFSTARNFENGAATVIVNNLYGVISRR